MSKLATLIEKNFAKRLEKVEAELRRMKTRPTVARSLAEITQDAGDLRGGRIIATEDEQGEPEDAAFTGAFMSALMQLIADGNQARIAEVVNGVMQFGIGDGAAWAGNKAIRLNADGQMFSQHGDLLIFGDENAQRVASIGFADGGAAFSIKQWKYVSNPPVNLVPDGDLETASPPMARQWNLYGSLPDEIVFTSDDHHSGSMCFRCTNLGGSTVYAESKNGFTVTDLAQHLLTFWVKEPTTGPMSGKVEVQSYSSGGALVGSEQVAFSESGLKGWRRLSAIVTPKTDGGTVRIKVTASNGTFLLDDIKLQELGMSSELRLDDNGYAVNTNGTIKLGALTLAGDMDVNGLFSLPQGPDLTIANGAITISASRHRVDTEGGTSTDTLTTINGGRDGTLLILQSVIYNRDITLEDNTGNLKQQGNLVLDTQQDFIVLLKFSGSWYELLRANNN